MRKLAMFAGVLAFGVNCVLAQNESYVGSTTQVLDGGDGYFKYNAACNAEFPGSTMCTTQELIEGGQAISASLPPRAIGAWMNAAPVGGGFSTGVFVIDFSGEVAHPERLNCDGWRKSIRTLTGLALFKVADMVTIEIASCAEKRAVACCALVEKR